ncbi:hypothetical protein AXK11_08675 [Cephaloticoccus primus]|uniref:Ribonuclease VapC n=1 Tax=Cephaloticoccus primus TaxID=1548207 RepID=A0A139SIL2_9BACT|nr:type II toxin-antitoxin system VapC family toxin [Cephaloticoccus primus]KXU34373.1 hypothetical protein AXK11_08675 [Cephaloticoccus primus]
MIRDSSELYFLDTNAASAFMRGKDELLVRLVRHYREQLLLSSIVWSELEFGAQKHPERRKYTDNLMRLRECIAEVEVFDELAARDTGMVRAYLEPRGMKIGPIDSLIAGHALSRMAGVITHNVGEFSRVPGLPVIDWQAAG